MSSHTVFAFAVRVVLLAALSAGVSLIAAMVYRWWGRERIPEGVALLLGVTAVALVLNTEQTLKQFLADGNGLDRWEAARTITIFAASAIGADVGRRIGDRNAERALAGTTPRLDRELTQVVRARGRVVTVTLPDSIEDIDGYDPLPEETKAEFAGSTFVFPRRVTVGELADRIRARLEDDYGVGHVDVEVTGEGEVTYLAVGARAAGLGPTLGPGTAAIAVQADPANAASPGDVVQVWTRSGAQEPQRLTNAEVRAAAGDVVTLALDESDAGALADDVAYRLVTMPIDSGADREFAALLRAADETMGTVTVNEGSPLAGTAIGALDVTVAALRRPDGGITPIPSRSTTVDVGSTLYVVARPDALRAFEDASTTVVMSGQATEPEAEDEDQPADVPTRTGDDD